MPKLFLKFRIGGEHYVIDAAQIAEVLPLLRITPVPQSPPALSSRTSLIHLQPAFVARSVVASPRLKPSTAEGKAPAVGKSVEPKHSPEAQKILDKLMRTANKVLAKTIS